MTRIVAGTAGGRRIAVPRAFAGRPTSERAREALFATLTSRLGSWDGRRFADLYAGTGAVGLEALSRGAAHALLVESDRAAARAITANARDIGLDGAVVVSRPVERVTAAPPEGGPYDVLFLDPPYPLPARDVCDVVAALLRGGWCAVDGVVVLERASRDAPFSWPDGIDPGTSRRYGDATFWYGHADSAGERRET